MKKLLFCLLLPLSAIAQVAPQPASQAEVNAAILHTKFVAPDTLAGRGGSGSPSAVVGGTFVVATNGSSSNTGTLTSPLADINQALTNLGGYGTIIVRGGSYTNGLNLDRAIGNVTIAAYANEDVRIISGIYLTNWTLLSNGIYTIAQPNTVNWLDTNIHTAASFAGSTVHLRLWEVGTPWGSYSNSPNNDTGNIFKNGATNYFGLSPIWTNQAFSNLRCPDYPIIWTNTISGLQNGYYCLSNGTIYVKFSDGGVPNGRDMHLMGTNYSDCAIYGGNANVSVTVIGIKSFYGNTGFELSRVGSATLKKCYAHGGYFGISFGADVTYPYYTMGQSNLQLTLEDCECSGGQLGGLVTIQQPADAFGTANSHPVANVVARRCYFHDCQGNNEWTGGGVISTLEHCVSEAGFIGYTPESGTVKMFNCQSLNNVEGVEMSGQGNSVLYAQGCNFFRDSSGIVVDGVTFPARNYCTAVGCTFDCFGLSIGVSGNSTTATNNFVRADGCIVYDTGVGQPGNWGKNIIYASDGTWNIASYPNFYSSQLTYKMYYVQAGTVQISGDDAAGGASLYVGAGAMTVTAAGLIKGAGYNSTLSDVGSFINSAGYTNTSGNVQFLHLSGTVVAYELWGSGGVPIITNAACVNACEVLRNGDGVKITTFTGGKGRATGL